MTDKKRVGKSAWREHMQDHSSPPPPEILTSDLQEAGVGVATPVLSVEVKRFRFMDKDTGRLIALCRPIGEPQGLPDVWRGQWNKNQVTIKGSSITLADVDAVGSIVECGGDWIMDPKFGLQFQFTWVREAMPSSIEALTTYLSSGRLKGIGPATAKQIVERFGMDTLRVLSETPDDLKTIPGLTPSKIETIQKEWAKKKDMYQLTSFFGLYGIGEVYIPKILEKMGPKGLEARIRDNPYLLTLVDGIGFATADKMALSLGLSRTSPKRTSAMLQHLLDEYTTNKGHTACPVDDWFRDACIQLSLPKEEIQPIAQELINKGVVVLRTLPVNRARLGDDHNPAYDPDAFDSHCVSLRQCYMNEKSIAVDIDRLRKNIQPLSALQQMKINQGLVERAQTLDASQVEGVLGVLTNGVSVLTGGPGTGKTTTLKSVIDIAQDLGWEVVLAAPTGRAAKRMEEAIGRPSSTIHRALKYNPKEGFTQNRKNPLVGQLFVVDEASMIDNALAASWLKAMPVGARVIFVGDIDQLPSVGAGSFLKDIMDSQAAQVFRLTRVHRQVEGSLIAEAAQKILAGRVPALNGDPWVDDFSWINPPLGMETEQVNQFIQSSISSLVDGYLKRGYKKEDIQVLSPQHDGLVGVHGLNDALRWQLNTKGRPHSAEEEQDFAIGDRLLVTKNNYDKDVFNGDMGVVQKMEDDGSIEMLMEDGKTVIIDRAERKSLVFGYAITVHKSQGGERPVIIMACSPSHTFSMNKNLIYTGITRGKSKVVVVGSSRTLNNALRKQEKMYRLTGLVREISQVVASPDAQPNAFRPK